MLEKIVNFGIVYLSIGLVIVVIILGITLYLIIKDNKNVRVNGYQPKGTITTEKVKSNSPKYGSAQQRK